MPEASANLAILSLVLNASLLVQVVMGLLLVLSLISWFNIFRKWFVVGREKRLTREFEQDFWAAPDTNALYQRIADGRAHNSMERIFEAGYKEALKSRKQGDLGLAMEGARRAMKAMYQREMDRLEVHLNFLATVGSVSPYIGLFGTVWGIMNAFRGLAGVGQATLAHVAPGIAEALVATAMGLFAAIPAVVAYNRFVNDIDRLANRLESFMEEYSNALQRQLAIAMNLGTGSGSASGKSSHGA